MALHIEVSEKKLTAIIDDELTIYTVNHFRELLTDKIKGINHVVINLNKVSEMDSAGLQLLVALKHLGSEYEVQFIEHSPAVTNVLALCGLSGQFDDSVLILREISE